MINAVTFSRRIEFDAVIPFLIVDTIIVLIYIALVSLCPDYTIPEIFSVTISLLCIYLPLSLYNRTWFIFRNDGLDCPGARHTRPFWRITKEPYSFFVKWRDVKGIIDDENGGFDILCDTFKFRISPDIAECGYIRKICHQIAEKSDLALMDNMEAFYREADSFTIQKAWSWKRRFFILAPILTSTCFVPVMALPSFYKNGAIIIALLGTICVYVAKAFITMTGPHTIEIMNNKISLIMWRKRRDIAMADIQDIRIRENAMLITSNDRVDKIRMMDIFSFGDGYLYDAPMEAIYWKWKVYGWDKALEDA